MSNPKGERGVGSLRDDPTIARRFSGGTTLNKRRLYPVTKPGLISKLSFIAALLLATLIAPVLRAQSDSELPAGPMQAKATTACTECHETRIIVQQRLSKAAWTKEVDKMIKWGAVVETQDHDPLIDYLSTNFGVDKEAYVADRTRTKDKNPKR